jgi:hypothetical protein
MRAVIAVKKINAKVHIVFSALPILSEVLIS